MVTLRGRIRKLTFWILNFSGFSQTRLWQWKDCKTHEDKKIILIKPKSTIFPLTSKLRISITYGRTKTFIAYLPDADIFSTWTFRTLWVCSPMNNPQLQQPRCVPIIRRLRSRRAKRSGCVRRRPCKARTAVGFDEVKKLWIDVLNSQ